MKKFIGLLLFLFTLFSFSVSGQVKSKAYSMLLDTLLSHSVQEITVQEASLIKGNTIFLDARKPNEYAISQIENAIFVGYDNFEINSMKNIAKDHKIIVYCSVGYRSEKIAEKLVDKGYSDVSNLYGGIFEWKNQDHEVYNDSVVTKKVHGFNKAWGIWLNKGTKVY